MSKRSRKKYGGDASGEQMLQQIKENRKTKSEQTAQNTQNDNKGSPGILGTSIAIAKGLTTKGIRMAGNFAGVDLDNPESATREFNKVIANSAVIGQATLKAADPFIEPMIDKTVEVLEKSGSKIAQSGMKILLNTAEEIPGVGVMIGTVRSLSNAGEAFVAGTDAIAEMTTTYADIMNATAQNMDKQIKDGTQTGGRTLKSIREFNRPRIRKTRRRKS